MVFDDRDSFAEQLVRNQHRVFAYIVTLLANRDDAEDAFQSTCLVLWKKWKEFDPSRDFFGWACGVAHNEVRNMLRQSRAAALSFPKPLRAGCRTRLRADAFLEIRSHFLSLCLERLSVGQRQLVEECYLGDKSIKVIAEEMSVSPAALTMRLQQNSQDSLRVHGPCSQGPGQRPP